MHIRSPHESAEGVCVCVGGGGGGGGKGGMTVEMIS